MGKGKDLTGAEKHIIMKEIAKGTPPKVIATSICRHVDTVKGYLANPSPRKTRTDAGVLKTVTNRDRRDIKRKLLKMPGRTSKTIFEKANLPEISKFLKNNLYHDMKQFTSKEDL